MLEPGKMKPGRRQTMNKIEKLYHHDRHMVLDWFIDKWPFFKYGLMDLMEDEINGLSRKHFLAIEQVIDNTTKKLNLDKPDNVIQFRRRA